MKSRKNQKIILAAVFVSAIVLGSLAYSHCQIPCGIYDDDVRIKLMGEHITTIEKSMNLIYELKNQDEINANQIVRWVKNKEVHADELSHIITYYFMAQRIKKAPENNIQEYKKYVRKLTLLHEMLVTTMKAKQTTDTANTAKLRTLLKQFHKAYSG
ncbi:MAG: superoxide dismutase [Ni] [Planctomycetota bacterium]|jgi:nickel superoxide dismutase